jgi:hypothetical protein
MRMKLAVIVIVAACRPAQPAHPPSTATALALVNRFVAAETLGTWRSADSLVRWSDCEGDPAEDQIPVIRNARIGTLESRGDTAVVPVHYDVAGAAWSDDAHRVGPKNWHFRPGSSQETVRYAAFVDSSGRLWIACGEFHEDHTAASQFGEELAHFDDSSLAAWHRASLPAK